MKIVAAISLDGKNLKEKPEPDHLCVYISDNGQIEGLRWRYRPEDKSLRTMVKKYGAKWDGSFWHIEEPGQGQVIVDKIRHRHPDWPLVQVDLGGHLVNNNQPLDGVAFSLLDLDSKLSALIFQFPLPYFSDIGALSSKNLQLMKLMTKAGKQAAILIVDSVSCIYELIHQIELQGARQDGNKLAKRFELLSNAKIQVKVSGWSVEIGCDLSNPMHYQFKPEQIYKWEGSFPNGVHRAISWDGKIRITKKQWQTWKNRIESAGLDWDGDNPDAEIPRQCIYEPTQIPGWASPAGNGHLYHAYQKEGIEFCANRGMRALIGDEMGVGKTAQAIGAVESTQTARVLVICPPNARYVWESEIKAWSRGGLIQHVRNQLETLDENARWHIVTYDQLTARVETWKINDTAEEAVFLSAFPERNKEVIGQKKYPKKIKFTEYKPIIPFYSDARRAAAWKNMMLRLKGELLSQIVNIRNIQVIMDEAHRAKNREAKRTKVIQKIAASGSNMLLLTGTPLRNNEHEAAVLLSFLDTCAADDLSEEKGYTVQDVKDYLDYFMIRRTKIEVLPELPSKTRQRMDIDQLDENALNDYLLTIYSAKEIYIQAIDKGKTEHEARQAMQGMIEHARTALGLAKVRGGEVAELIADVVENKECCVVFCAHHQVSDTLHSQLLAAGFRAEVVDGRTPSLERARIVADFQAGLLDVFIGGINSAGEAITLTRADTVVFVELDWVPAALMQAEDRVHRIGQKSNCHVIHLIARFDGENLDEDMIMILGSKLERIGNVLDESTANLVGEVSSLKKTILRKLIANASVLNNE